MADHYQTSETNLPAAPVLPDVIAPGLTVLFCGSAAGRVSAAVGDDVGQHRGRW